MSSAHVLAALAQRLNRDAGAPAIPSLYFFTDPARTPDPVAVAQRLPRGAAVVFRHFGAADRARTAERLARVRQARALYLFIAADAELAARVGADGIHWPEHLAPQRVDGVRWMTVAAHSAAAVARADSSGADACFLSPVFETQSAGSGPALGLFRASQIARSARLPVIALGGVNARTGPRLAGRGFAGIAAVDALRV